MERRLLVVDDETEIVELLQMYFSSKSYTVDPACTAPGALEKIRNTVYDVIITDIRLPGNLTGMDILKAALERSPETRVIMITGYGSIKNAVEAMKIGAFDYITKPFDYDELGMKVDRIFELKELNRDIEDKAEAIRAIEDSAQRNIGGLEWQLTVQNEKLGRIRALVEKALGEVRGTPAEKTLEALRAELDKDPD